MVSALGQRLRSDATNCPGSVNCIFWTGLDQLEYKVKCYRITAGASNVTGFEVGIGGTPTYQNASGAYHRISSYVNPNGSPVATAFNDTNTWLFAIVVPTSGTGAMWEVNFQDFNISGVTQTFNLLNSGFFGVPSTD